jgi:hypothetical protein
VSIDKLEKTRIGLSGFEAFKQQKQEESKAKRDSGSPPADDVKPPEANSVVHKEIDTDTLLLAEPDPQSELGLNEPPVVVEKGVEPTDWAHSIPESTLIQWWNEFIETQSMKTASLMKMVRPSLDGKDVVVTIAASKMEVLEAVKFPFNRFIADKSEGKLTSLRIEAGEVVQQERRPYTDKEKLDYMIKKHPELEDIIKKLGLRLP